MKIEPETIDRIVDVVVDAGMFSCRATAKLSVLSMDALLERGATVERVVDLLCMTVTEYEAEAA